MMDVVWIGDSHARPGVSNRRYTWLGKLIVDLKPDVVVDMGDWTDVPSLSSYDGSALTGHNRPTKNFEGRRYLDDIAAGVEARDRVHVELQKAARKRPRRLHIGGNHDTDRITRAVNMVPELEGVISKKDQQLDKYGWEDMGFLNAVDVGGFHVQHYFTSGLLGRPIGGDHLAANILSKNFHSGVQGHTHLFDMAKRTGIDGRKLFAFSCGCFLDPKQVEGYAGPAQKLWDLGILHMRGVENGVPTGGFAWIPITEIERAYR